MIRFLVALFFFVSSVASAIPQDATPGVYTPGFYSTANFVKNPSCTTNTTNVTASGGSLSRTTTTPLSSIASCLIDASASGQTYKFSTRTIDNGLNGQNCEARFTYSGDGTLYKAYVEQPSGTKVSQEVTLIDTTAATKGKDVSLTFPCGSNSNATILTIESTSSSAAAIRVADAYVGKITTTGTVQNSSDWTSFTPTGSWSSNTTYSGKWRKVGDTMEVSVYVSMSGAPSSGSLTVNLPSGYTIDTNKRTFSQFNSVVGKGGLATSGNAAQYPVQVVYNNTTSVNVAQLATDTGSNPKPVNQGSPVTPTSPVTLGSGSIIELTFEVPISGWTSSSTAVRADQSNVPISSFTPTGTWLSNATYVGKYRRDGEYGEFQIKVTTSGVPTSAELNVDISSICTIDMTKIAGSTGSGPIGNGFAADNGVALYGGQVFIKTSTTVALATLLASSGSNHTLSGVTQAIPFSFGSTDYVEMNFRVPCVGWTESQKAPILVGSVTSGSTGAERIERVAVTTTCSSSPCTIDSQSGSWVSSITRSGTGVYVVNINSGMFSAAPTCIANFANNVASSNCKAYGASTASVGVYCDNGSAVDSKISLICMGPR